MIKTATLENSSAIGYTTLGYTLPERNAPLNIAAHAVYPDQFAFQREHVIGSILNVGCNTDGAELWKRGAINVDLYDTDPQNGNPLPVHVIADARDLPDDLYGRFDCVVLGELLEHMEASDAIHTLDEAVCCLKHRVWRGQGDPKSSGRVVITIPHDHRREDGTLPIPDLKEYAPGVHAFHYRKIERAEVFDWLKQADLEPIYCAEIRYPFDGVIGSGIVAVSR